MSPLGGLKLVDWFWCRARSKPSISSSNSLSDRLGGDIGAKMQLSDRIGRRMKLQDLHVLMAVVQAGSMRKAAALLNTTQPAISRSIAELEHAIGVRLLDRGSQGVELTQYGRALLRRG